MFRDPVACSLLLLLAAMTARADTVLYRYEGDVLPYDPSAGWLIADHCSYPCTELLEDGNFVLFWPETGQFANYALIIPQPADPPPSFWVEWNFRSNQPFGGVAGGCDGRLRVRYGYVFDGVHMTGDTAISFEGGDFVLGLALDVFHTYRFETHDGLNYTVSVDGQVFMEKVGHNDNKFPSLQFSGRNGCISESLVNKKNSWDFIRYGTLDEGAVIEATDPPEGTLYILSSAVVDRFTVIFDEPAYVYVDEITVATTGGTPPQVTATRRLHNGEPNELEIVLDGPMPVDETTTITISDGSGVDQVIEFHLVVAPPCCLGDGSCSARLEADCVAQGGTPLDIALLCEGDQDGDGVDGLCGDSCPLDPDDDIDGDGLCGDVDPCPTEPTNDSDGDGLCDGVDPCPFDPDNDIDEDGLCGDVDPCPLDPDNDIDGDGLCGDVDPCPTESTNDSDGDGLCDGVDPCPFDPDNDIDGDGVCGDVDPCPRDNPDDSDGDGVCDSDDQCPGVDDTLYAPECAAAIPTTSTWGLVVLALTLLAAAKVYHRSFRAS